MGQLDGKVAIVTGANKGIGKAIAKAYAKEGANVVLASIDFGGFPLKAVEEEILADGGNALAVYCDLGKEEDIQNAVDVTIEKYGRVDILCNVGQGGMHSSMVPLEKLTTQDLYNVFSTGPAAYALFIQKCAPYMIKQEFGRIINFSSGVIYGVPGHLPYAMAKASVNALTRCVASEIGKYNITCNTIMPSAVTGESSNPLKEQHQKLREESAKTTPCGYVGTPKDIVPMCVFLARDDARFVQGLTMVLEGGKHMIGI